MKTENLSKDLHIIVEIPHQRPASVLVLSPLDHFYCISEKDWYDYDKSWQDNASHDLHGFRVYANWKEAFAAANVDKGHQAARVLSEMRKEFARWGNI